MMYFDLAEELKHNESSMSLQQDTEESSSVPWNHSADNISVEITKMY